MGYNTGLMGVQHGSGHNRAKQQYCRAEASTTTSDAQYCLKRYAFVYSNRLPSNRKQ